MNLRERSLRMQLTMLGAVAVLVPLVVLLFVVAFTFSSEEVFLDPSGESRRTLQESTTVPAPVVIAAFLLSIAGCVAVWFWAGRAVRPMEQIARVADEIQAGSLDRRIDLRDGAGEVRRLAESFDAMLDRLSLSSNIQQRLIEDASHELRTPLAALAVNNEIILGTSDADVDAFRASAERSEALIARLQRTIDELLVDARARSQQLRRVDNDLVGIATRVVDHQRLLDPDVPIVIDGPAELRLGIDGPSVERALANLVENACRYSPIGCPVEVTLAGGSAPSVSVTDQGPGIAESQMASVFDRYHRDDASEGSGIGLALVKQVAEAHGRIEVLSPPPERATGTRFTIWFS